MARNTLASRAVLNHRLGNAVEAVGVTDEELEAFIETLFKMRRRIPSSHAGHVVLVAEWRPACQSQENTETHERHGDSTV